MAKFEYSDLLDRKLVTVKAYANGLKVIKYSKRVFYNSLWNEDARLLEARGLVIDKDNEIVARPMLKVFNYGEQGAGKDVSRDAYVFAARKVNGFLICVTYSSAIEDFIINTTGTLDSEFVELGKKWITDNIRNMAYTHDDITFMFEVCDASDPHIVKEEEGIYLLGARVVETGEMLHQDTNYNLANRHGLKTPEGKWVRYGELLDELKSIRHEGWMVRDYLGNYIVKLKSPYYLTTKFLARNNKILEEMLKHPDRARKYVEEEFYDLIDWLADQYGERFMQFDQQARINVVEQFYERQTK